MIITVDGPVAAGKGTLARRLAERFGYGYLDTGGIYRAVALRLLRMGADLDDTAAAVAAAGALTEADLSDPALRDEATGDAASHIAAQPAVRAALLAFQRGFAARPPDGKPGAVLDGRDIGTVVCPRADVKLFVTASPEARAERRHVELRQRGVEVSYDEVLGDLRRRDARDSERGISPLRPADDAHLLDTTNLSIEAAFRAACDIVAGKQAAT